MNIYLAGPLFSPAERAFLSDCARTFRAAGIECFVPHEHELALGDVSARTIFEVDFKGLEAADALVAWLDGSSVDDGTACEVGIFYGLMRVGHPRRKGIIGLCTDLRRLRRRSTEPTGGLNLFLAGTVLDAGRICWSVDEARDQLLAWKRELEGG